MRADVSPKLKCDHAKRRVVSPDRKQSVQEHFTRVVNQDRSFEERSNTQKQDLRPKILYQMPRVMTQNICDEPKPAQIIDDLTLNDEFILGKFKPIRLDKCKHLNNKLKYQLINRKPSTAENWYR